MVGSKYQLFKILWCCVHWLQSHYSCFRVKICMRQELTCRQSRHSNWGNSVPEHFARCKQQSGSVIIIRAYRAIPHSEHSSRYSPHSCIVTPNPPTPCAPPANGQPGDTRNMSNSFRTLVQKLWNHMIINNIIVYDKNCFLKVGSSLNTQGQSKSLTELHSWIWCLEHSILFWNLLFFFKLSYLFINEI